VLHDDHIRIVPSTDLGVDSFAHLDRVCLEGVTWDNGAEWHNRVFVPLDMPLGEAVKYAARALYGELARKKTDAFLGRFK
jgi:hypothetical protein